MLIEQNEIGSEYILRLKEIIFKQEAELKKKYSIILILKSNQTQYEN